MTVDIFNTENRYDLILADPPWKQSKGGKKSVRANSSGRPLDYQVCTLEEIEEHLKAAVSLMGENSILFLWTIDKYLFEAQEIAERLGYKLHARLIWNKVTGIPAAFTVRYGHEYLLYMYKGNYGRSRWRNVERYIPSLRSGCSGIRKSPKYRSILSSGYTLPKRKSNYTPAGRVRAGIAGGTKYERSIIK